MFKRGLLVAGTFIAMTVLVGSTPIFSLSRELPGNNTPIESQGVITEIQEDTSKKSYKELVQSIPTEIMSYSGEDEDWKASYVVIREGQSTTRLVGLTQKVFDLDENKIKYTIETKNEKTEGVVETSSLRAYSVQTDIIPENDEVVKITIECGNKKSILQLKSGITDEVIPPEKAVEVFMDRFGTSDKEIGYIVFSNAFGRKTWQLLTSIGTADINAITGEFQYLYTERESD